MTVIADLPYPAERVKMRLASLTARDSHEFDGVLSMAPWLWGELRQRNAVPASFDPDCCPPPGMLFETAFLELVTTIALAFKFLPKEVIHTLTQKERRRAFLNARRDARAVALFPRGNDGRLSCPRRLARQ
jgi:hypothetical protein